jgi:hypothetical protein
MLEWYLNRSVTMGLVLPLDKIRNYLPLLDLKLLIVLTSNICITLDWTMGNVSHNLTS